MHRPRSARSPKPTSGAASIFRQTRNGRYCRARYYHPGLQRFISEDPIGFEGGDPNLYAYVGNMPTAYADPLGLFADILLDAGFIAYDLGRLVLGGRKELTENLTALGLDVVGAVVPFAAGLGPTYRVGRAVKSANAADALRRKLSALEHAQASAARTRTLADGRIRFYGEEVAARQPGMTRGASLVTEYDRARGGVRQWMESYGHDGRVLRVHPKMIDGEIVHSRHFPPTAAELGR